MDELNTSSGIVLQHDTNSSGAFQLVYKWCKVKVQH